MNPRASQRCSIFLFLLVSVVVLAANVAAAPPLPFGDRSDGEVGELLDKLSSLAQAYREGGTHGGVLLESSTFVDAQSASYAIVHNRALHALEGGDEHMATQSISLGSNEQLVRAGGWIVRADGSLVRLGDRDVRIDRVSKDGPAEVVFAFPQMQVGDTAGWSVVAKSDVPFYVRWFMLDAEFPVASGRFTLKLDGTVGYSVQAFNVRKGSFEASTVERKNGNPSRIVCTYGGLEPDREDVMGLPWRQRRACVLVNYKGYYIEDVGMWYAIRSWNEIAYTYGQTLKKITSPEKALKRQAESIVAGSTDAAARADALHRFVRDEIVTLDTSESSFFTPAKKILEARAGDGYDKAVLLVALLRSIGIGADLGFARDRYSGGLLHNDPGFWQFTDAVVRSRDSGHGEPDWYVPGTEGCPPRTLPPHLRGVEIVFFQEDTEKEADAIFRRLLGKHGDNPVPLFRDYLERLRAQSWSEIVRSSGNSAEIAGIVDEVRVVDVEARTETVTLTAQGIVPEGNWARTGTPAEDCAKRYCENRGLRIGSVHDSHVAVTDDGQVATFGWTADFEAPLLAPDTWVLPAELVFGDPLFAFWKGADRGPIFVPVANRRVLRTEIVLPAGWELATAMTPVSIVNPLLVYECKAQVRDGRLVVERTVDFKAGALGVESLTMLDRDFRQILDMEMSALVVRAGAGPDAAADSR